MNLADTGIRFLDLGWHGRRGVGACAVLESAAGLVLVDPIADPSLVGLTDALADSAHTLSDVSAVLLTGSVIGAYYGAAQVVAYNRRARLFAPEAVVRLLNHPSRLRHLAAATLGHPEETVPARLHDVSDLNIEIVRPGDTIGPGGLEIDLEDPPVGSSVIYSLTGRSTVLAGAALGAWLPGADLAIPPLHRLVARNDAAARIIAFLQRHSREWLALSHFGPVEAGRFSESLTRWVDSAGARPGTVSAHPATHHFETLTRIP